jgi:hypothetical protein
VNFITTTPPIGYDQAAEDQAINIYTSSSNNYFFWDSGQSAINGVGQGDANNSNFYSGSAGNLQMTINNSANISFAPTS